MADEAVAAGLRIDARRYEHLVGVPPGTPLPASNAVDGEIHRHESYWAVLGFGLEGTCVPTPAHVLHPSVQQRIDGTAGSAKPDRPQVGQP